MGVFEVGRDDLHRCRFVEVDSAPLDEGQVRVAVEAFGFSANNITYAVFGDAMKYWDFWPAEEGWGRVPVWGYAQVVESRHQGVGEGETFYGYLPMASEAVLTVAKADERRLVEGSPYRVPLPSPYNSYSRADGDPAHDPERRAHQMVLRPLFATGWLMADQIEDHDGYGAQQVVLSSASSKTALSTAFVLARWGGAEVVGLTSPGNVEFCEGLGSYDRVATYDSVADLEGDTAVYVDMSGNEDVRRAVHQRFGEGLRHSAVVGATHWNAESDAEPEGAAGLPGPKPTFFFAPDRISKRIADWGGTGFDERMGAAWDDFVAEGVDWMQVRHGEGPETVGQVYLEQLDGTGDPAVGHVLSL